MVWVNYEIYADVLFLEKDVFDEVFCLFFFRDKIIYTSIVVSLCSLFFFIPVL